MLSEKLSSVGCRKTSQVWTQFCHLALVVLLHTPAFAAFDAFPENVRQSFAWGITDNSALKIEDLTAMAKALLISKGKSEQEVEAELKGKTDKEIKEIITSPFLIEYVEVAANEVEKLGRYFSGTSQYLPQEHSPISFTKDGVEMMRWFISPLRSDRSFLNHFGNPEVKRGQFLAQLTESRSVVLMDRESGETWSLKLSLPEAFGPFKKGKEFQGYQAQFQFRMSEHLLKLKDQKKLPATQFMAEVGFSSFESADFSEGQLVRSLDALKKGRYLLPYSAIFTGGLEKFARLNPGIDPGKQTKRWLSVEPGRAAANLFFVNGLSLNSNHSQNSLLILSPEKVPIGYLRRDTDLDLAVNEPGADEVRSFFRVHASDDVQLDYSMSNGLEATHYTQAEIERFAIDFFSSAVNRLQKLKGAPKLNWDIRKLVEYNNRHYVLDTNILPRVEEISSDQRTAFAIMNMEYKENFPEIGDIKSDPKAGLVKLLSRPNMRKGFVSNLSLNLNQLTKGRSTFGLSALLKEFANPQTREKSFVWKLLHQEEVEPLWNFCILLGNHFKMDWIPAIETLMIEAGKTEHLNAIQMVLHNMKKATIGSSPRDARGFPPGYVEMLQTYMRHSPNDDYHRHVVSYDIKRLSACSVIVNP